MVSQALAARRPELVRSLTSLMSNTGSRITGQPALGILRHFLKRAPTERDAYIEYSVMLFGLIGSDGSDPSEVRELAERHWERGSDPRGTGRQLGAILKSGHRGALLRRIEAPTLVIHGTKDKLVRPSGGSHTARLIPGAKLMRIERMGHDLPRWGWPRIIDAITEHTRRADAAQGDGRDRAAAAA
jgi:pimeloyl-ACP methyl ester carboxylesterase